MKVCVLWFVIFIILFSFLSLFPILPSSHCFIPFLLPSADTGFHCRARRHDRREHSMSPPSELFSGSCDSFVLFLFPSLVSRFLFFSNQIWKFLPIQQSKRNWKTKLLFTTINISINY